MPYRRSKFLALIIVLALASAACGNDDAGPTDTEPATTQPSDGGADEAPDDGGGTAADDGGASMGQGATVAVDGEEFVLDVEAVCVTMGGALGAQFTNGGGDVNFSIDLPPESWDGTGDDWQPASVRLDDNRDPQDPVSWRAGDDVVAGMEGLPPEVTVTEFSIDGSTATGTATVVDLDTLIAGEPETAPMTFSVTCG